MSSFKLIVRRFFFFFCAHDATQMFGRLQRFFFFFKKGLSELLFQSSLYKESRTFKL